MVMITVRRSPSCSLVIAYRPSIVLVLTSAGTKACVTGVIATTVAVAVVVAVTAVVTAVTVVTVVGATTIAPGAERAADEREQLLHVPVELVGQAGNAGAVADLGVPHVGKYVRLEMHGLGVPLVLLLFLLLPLLLLLLLTLPLPLLL